MWYVFVIGICALVFILFLCLCVCVCVRTDRVVDFRGIYNTSVQGCVPVDIGIAYDHAETKDPFIAGEIARHFTDNTQTALDQYSRAVKDLPRYEDYNMRIDNIRDFTDEIGLALALNFADLRKHVMRVRADKHKHTDNLRIVQAVTPQSVHDSVAVNIIGDHVTTIISDNKECGVEQDMTHTLATITDAITCASHDKQVRAKKTFDVLNEVNAFVDRYGACEKDVLVNTWNRAYVPENKDNASNIKDAVITALADSCVGDQYSVVCAMGRVSNIVSSLAGVDHDPKMGVVLDTTTIRNMCYEKAAHVRNTNGTVQDLRDALREYETLLNPDDYSVIVEECVDAL